MFRLRLLSGTQVSDWNTSTIIPTPARGTSASSGWVQYLDDPLTSLSTMNFGSGTWTINTYLQAYSASGSVNMRAWSTTTAPTSPCAQLVEVEVEIPATFSANGHHFDLGWLTGDSGNRYLGGVRGDNVVAFVQDSVAWVTTSAYTHPSAGTWVKLAVLWDHSTNTWKLWVDGVLWLTWTISQTFSTSYRPGILAYNAAAGQSIRFRNLKSWYQINSSYVGLP